MHDRGPGVRGRGTAENPSGRFERLEVVRDGWRDEEDPSPRTRLLRDASRSILTRNSSPDLGFEFSLNPYRGCEHGCVYCLDGATPILMADGSTRGISEVRPGDAIYGTRPFGWYRHLVKARVLARWGTHKPAYHVTLAEGTEVVASGDHRFLTDRGWKHVTGEQQGHGRRPYLTTRNKLMGVGAAIRRSFDLEARALKTAAGLRVVAVEALGIDAEMFDITTTTGDFIANGVVSHNCYARPGHEYLGFSAGLDFETNILVKEDAPALLARELSSRRWQPQTIVLSSVTDPYQPVERRLRITRGCLEVLARFRNPVAVITKNHLVTRDADLLAELASAGAAHVTLSITTLDNALHHVMEPRTATPARRLHAIEVLARAGVPVGVNVAPVIPGLTDHEVPRILEAAAAAGASTAGWGMLRLPYGVKDLFVAWLERHFPDRREKVLGRIRDVRGGRLNDSRFGKRMRGEGPIAAEVKALFEIGRRRAGLDRRQVGASLSTAAFRSGAGGPQLGLFPESPCSRREYGAADPL